MGQYDQFSLFSDYGYQDMLRLDRLNLVIGITEDDKVLTITDGKLSTVLKLDEENGTLNLLGVDDEIITSVSLPNASSIKDAYFDKETDEIVIVIYSNGGELKEVRFSLDLTKYTTKEYTDNAIDNAQNQLTNEINRATAAENELSIKVDTKINTVELIKSEIDDLHYILYVDNVNKGEINIPKNQFLKSANYEAETKELVFVFETESGNTETRIDVADLVDEYTAGNGLTLFESKEFSIDETIVATNLNVDNKLKAKVDVTAYDNDKADIYDKINHKLETNEFYDNKIVVDEKLDKKLDKIVYEADKPTFETIISSDKKLEGKLDKTTFENNNIDVDNKIDAKLDKAIYDADKPTFETIVSSDAKLETKLDKTDYDANNIAINDKIATKLDTTVYEADKPTFETIVSSDAKLQTKLDKTTYEANKTDVDNKIDAKLDKAVYDTDKPTFALNDDVNEKLSHKLDSTVYEKDKITFETIASSDAKLESKLDKTIYEADKTTLNEKIDTEITRATNAENVLDVKIDSVKLLNDPQTNPLKYTLMVDGVEKGIINIPKDQFLKTASYDDTTKELVFVFEVETGQAETRIDVGHLVDVYEAGNGLKLTDNSFSIDESIVETVGSNTFKLSMKQDTLVSGTNIKTINGVSLLGNGDIDVEVDLTGLVSKSGDTMTGDLTINANLSVGTNNTNTGIDSFVQGTNCTSSGHRSHAEGEDTTSTSLASHAEGRNTRATEYASHSEGYNTTASGSAAHSEGHSTSATTMASHAEGWYTNTTNTAEHASGLYNKSISGTSQQLNDLIKDKDATLFSIGNGSQVTDVITTNNAFEVKFNGDAYVDNNLSIGTDNIFFNHFNSAFGINSLAQGSGCTAGGENSLASGLNTFTQGKNSFAQGENCSASGENSHAEGYAGGANGKNSHSEGEFSEANGENSHAEGYAGEANGKNSHAEGQICEANGDNSHAEGVKTYSFGESSHAEGWWCQTTGTGSHAEGSFTESRGLASHTEGEKTITSGRSSHAEGYGTITYNYAEHASGIYNESTSGSVQQIAFLKNDPNATLFSIGNGSEKYDGTIERKNAVEVKFNGDTYFSNDANFKQNLTAKTISATTITSPSIDAKVENVQLLKDATNPLKYTLLVDNANKGEINIPKDQFLKSAAYENTTKELVFIFETETGQTETRIDISHLVDTYEAGNGLTLTNNEFSIDTSIVETKTSSDAKLATKQDTLVSGTNIKTINGVELLGTGNIDVDVDLTGLVAKSGDTITGNLFIDNANVSIGKNNIFTDGVLTAENALAQGEGCLVNSPSAHAEGYFTKAFSGHAHAEGFRTTANGTASHAEGYQTVTNAPYSHTEGYGTQTKNIGEHACGIYNESTKGSGDDLVSLTNDEAATLFSIGNGEVHEGLEITPKNAFEVKYNGDAYVEKTLNVGGSIKLGTIQGGKGVGVFSFTQGTNLLARGKNAHAEGNSSIALGDNSHAEGYGTQTTNNGEHASGFFNVSTEGTSQSIDNLTNDPNATIFSIGNGTSFSNRKNCLEIKGNGDIYIYKNGVAYKLQDLLP